MDVLRTRSFVTACLLLCVCLPLKAEVVSLQMPNGLWASAEYVEGEADQPVVMIVHGFLQTREFSTVARLGSSLKDEGYTVFMPTLSLNVDQRKQSVACEAIHSHTMQGDVEELDVWLNWLGEKTDKPVYLVGHSAGSTHILALMENRDPAPVDAIILISLLHFDEDPLSHNTAAAYERALELQKQGEKTLETFSLAFCAEYPSEPSPFISYREWGKERTVSALNNLQISPGIILGGSDGRITPDWTDALVTTRANLVVVEEAGHFFDAQNEFELLDRVTGLMEPSGF